MCSTDAIGVALAFGGLVDSVGTPARAHIVNRVLKRAQP